MGNYRLISGDDHVSEPVDLWTTRVESKFRARAPHIVRIEDGSDWWYTDGSKGVPVVAAAQAGVRFDDIDKLSQQGQVEDIPAGAYDPDARIVDMDLDGIYASVIYANQGLLLYTVPDTELLQALFKPYNDWLAEYCQTHPKRLIGIAMTLLDDVEWGVRELERCHKLGYTGAMIPVYPTPDRPYHLPEYEPFWSAAEDLGMAISLHIGTLRQSGLATLTDFENVTPDYFCNTDYWVRQSLCQMIMGGVFEQHPKLQIGSIENEASWGALLMVNMDYTYTQRNQLPHWHRYKEDMLPSDYFRRNVFLGFQEDALGIQLREHIGINTLQWGSDYPHIESTFPRSQEILDDILADCSEDEKAQIAGGNAAEVYHID